MKLYLFDLDGTLITSYMDRQDRDYHAWAVLPGRRKRLGEIRERGDLVGIVTNQAGVAFGHITEQDVTDKLNYVLLSLKGLVEPDLIAYECAHPNATVKGYSAPERIARRKPSGQMIRELMLNATYDHETRESFERAQLGGTPPYEPETLYVGDRPEDEQAAADAGVAFQWAEEFFGNGTD